MICLRVCSAGSQLRRLRNVLQSESNMEDEVGLQHKTCTKPSKQLQERLGHAFFVDVRACTAAALFLMSDNAEHNIMRARRFAAGVFTYCGLGTFIKSRLPNHSDACYNNIPQRDFWFDLPNLVGDGVVFAASMGARKAKQQGTYEAVGPFQPLASVVAWQSDTVSVYARCRFGDLWECGRHGGGGE